MNPIEILENYAIFKEPAIKDRFFKHAGVVKLLARLPDEFEVTALGLSVKGRSISQVKWGNGDCKIMLWSQMHGDEPTGTMAIFDLINFLQQKSYANIVNTLKLHCTIYFIPMVNPDGAEVFTRRNIQQIDINRDYLAGNTPEGRILKAAREKIRPAFGFNLHDQVTLWSVKGTNKPATISYLSPAAEATHGTNEVRKQAKLVIAEMFKQVHPFISGHIGLFDETYEPRAFGDNFQKEGTSTILIEAGGLKDDFEKQEIRKYFFLSMLSGINCIATGTFNQQTLDAYDSIPSNAKTLYHIIIHQVKVNGMKCSLSLNYEDVPTADYTSTEKVWYIHDIGDTSGWEAYAVYNEEYEIPTPLVVDQRADFDVLADGKLILSFKNGILVHS